MIISLNVYLKIISKFPHNFKISDFKALTPLPLLSLKHRGRITLILKELIRNL